MGVFNVVALAAEASVLAWYAGVPLYYGEAALLRDDVRAIAHPKQSLAALAALSLFRLAWFTYIRQRNKRVPSTRFFVFCVSLVEGVVMALASLQPLVFWRNKRAFSRLRAQVWGASFVYALWGLAMFSAVLQLWYILQLNKSRGKLADDRLISDVLSEQDAKRARWRTKWDSLVKQFRRKATDPTFEAMVRLYAHRDSAIDRLTVAAERHPDEFEFYQPQLTTFLLLGVFVQSPQLCRLLLEKCSASHVFAHRMLWYLQSYCLWNPSFRTDEATRQVQVLIEEVCERGAEPARAIERPPVSPSASSAHANTDEEHSTMRRDWTARVSASTTANEVDCLLPPAAKDDHYATFHKQVAAIDYAERGVAADPFELETAFLGALANLSSNLRSVAMARRNEMLQKWLGDLELQFFPSNSLYLPVGNPYHRIKRLHISESFTFSTRERVPFLLCVEVVDYPPPDGARTAHLKRRSGSVSYARRFTLTMFDKPTLSEAGIVPSERTPLVSPDAAALGFWSESKPPSSPTRLRSFSQHISMSQPAEILHGIIDTLKRKGPGGGKQSSTGSTTDATHEALLPNGNGMSVDDLAIRSYHWDGERSRSQPFMKSPALTKNAVSIDSAVARLNAQAREGGGEAAVLADAAARASRNARGGGAAESDDGGVWSPRSDTILSPQSVGSAYSPPPLARFDSTDRFLQDMMERDSKLDDDDDTNGNSQALLAPESQRRHSDLPCVIFKERWAEKERRVQQTSPYGYLNGWRLLPVIVKSDDDLRQEQLASQLIKQFSKVFEEFQVPVFLRPYDVVAITSTSGLVEAIPDTISIDSLKRNDREFTTLLDFFTRHFGDPSSSAFKEARANFVRSMAAYSIVCYLLQVKDRHNGNILLDAEGHIIHIDFGFFLSNNPGNMAFEQAPFKLTQEFVELMGGPRSAAFRRFRSLCVRSFLVARKYRHRFILLVEMMLHGNEHLPCFGGDPKGAVKKLAARFQPDLDINSCEDFVHSLIDASLDNWRTNWYDRYQRWIVGVF